MTKLPPQEQGLAERKELLRKLKEVVKILDRELLKRKLRVIPGKK